MARTIQYYCSNCGTTHNCSTARHITAAQLKRARQYMAHRKYKVSRNPNSNGNGTLKNDMYSGFHQADPSHTRMVQVPLPEGPLIAVGKAVKIEYEPYGKSKYNNTRFFHNFGDLGSRTIKQRPILTSDKNGNLFFVPQHPKYPHFTDRGIMG